MNSFFYEQSGLKNADNSALIDEISFYSESHQQQIYILQNALGDSRYDYEYEKCFVVLSPGYKIVFLNFGENAAGFEDYIEDFMEDLGSISDKFNYKNTIGRPREWRRDLIEIIEDAHSIDDLEDFFDDIKINDGLLKKKSELIISLLTGSINDIDKVKGNVPDNILDKVKQKIILFDGEQTRFVYQAFDKKLVRIQGLSGTGKTELLLHKLKEIYLDKDDLDSRIIFTCHNKILADNMRKRIPEFFNFMKVEQQISWNERLWCVSAWGSQGNANSGAYRYICAFYNIPFQRYGWNMPFKSACKMALNAIDEIPSDEFKFAFDYMLVDESQDFPDSFVELCAKVTRKTVYVAGDIFQSIFDSNISNKVESDFTLSKCYRTDPRTLMFAHGLGMGLFEDTPLTWLSDEEWNACGYIVERDNRGNKLRLKREPLRRFEDVTDANIHSVELAKTVAQDATAVDVIIDLIDRIITDNPTVLADDIGIIFIDDDKSAYTLADRLEHTIERRYGWHVNKAYESKEKIRDTLFVSNKNNVKGLEFPFVICVTEKIRNNHNYRNALYMMLTRSFIKSYLVLSDSRNEELIEKIVPGLNEINDKGYMTVTIPPQDEIDKIKTTISFEQGNVSHYDFVETIMDEVGVMPVLRGQIRDVIKIMAPENFDYEYVKALIKSNYDALHMSKK
ncbi:TPA: DEAD/DEAH box helicase [Escherichia coli]|nr:ATP-binding domain-containing protein [Escherichia coli]